MISLVGVCLGVVKNTDISNGKSDKNCHWKSGDYNYATYIIPNNKVIDLS